MRGDGEHAKDCAKRWEGWMTRLRDGWIDGSGEEWRDNASVAPLDS